MNWFCLYTSVASEGRAFAGLNALQLHCYLPIATRIRRLRGNMVEIRAPLLARYLFVRLEECELAVARAVNGVQEILPHEHDPVAVPCCQVERLREREAAGEFRFECSATGKRRERVVLRSLSELAICHVGGYFDAS